MHGRRLSLQRRCALPLFCVAALAASASGATARSASTATAGTPRCATRGLVIWLDTQGDAAAGSRYYQLEFTNLSGHVCTLRGYPGASAVDLRGHQLGNAASRNPARPRRLVTLANGATATTVLQVAEARNFPRSVCRPSTAAGLRVYPPDQTASKLVPFPFLACSRSGPGFLSIQPVQKP
jgi:hypothetical protein